eukprot:g14040.t1
MRRSHSTKSIMSASDDMTLSSNSNISSFAKAIPFYKNNIVLLTFFIATLYKLLLMFSYRSTDFEVHRNWLAITFSKPLHIWYGNASESEWTLDYPPFFAYFECFLAQFAYYFFDKEIVNVQNLNYHSNSVIYFQHLLGAFFFAVLLCFKHLWLYSAPVYGIYLFRHHCFDLQNGCTSNRTKMLMDNVKETLKSSKHVSLDKYEWGDDSDEEDEEDDDEINDDANQQSNKKKKSNKKNRMIQDIDDDADDDDSSDMDIDEEFYATTRKERSPSLELQPKKLGRFNFTAFIELAIIVLTVFFIAFAPLIYQAYMNPPSNTNISGEENVILYMKQILSRLFPFGRGLTHAYWAPNIWALYNLLDKANTDWGINILKIAADIGSTTTSGNVGVVAGHIILPQITGLHTMILTLLFMSPMLYYLFHNPHPKLFVHAFVFAQMTSFMCGYHVHEKAILYAILPMTLLSCDSRGDARVYMLLSWIGHFSLLPLLFEIREQPLQLFAYVLHVIASYITLDTYMQNEERKMRIKETGVVFKWYQLMYLLM